jgi:hypothetical protein
VKAYCNHVEIADFEERPRIAADGKFDFRLHGINAVPTPEGVQFEPVYVPRWDIERIGSSLLVAFFGERLKFVLILSAAWPMIQVLPYGNTVLEKLEREDG